VVLLATGVSHEQREFYLQKSAQYGWTRALLSHHISAELYERSVLEKRTNNFANS